MATEQRGGVGWSAMQQPSTRPPADTLMSHISHSPTHPLTDFIIREADRQEESSSYSND